MTYDGFARAAAQASLRELSDEALRELHSAVVQVIRLRTGSLHDSASARLAALEIEASCLFEEWTRPDQLSSRRKGLARLRLGDDKAQWSAKTTNKGVRVTRIR